MTGTTETVTVLYKYVDGAHFFVSGDSKTRGLCIAHNDLSVAFKAVAPTLKILFRENHNEDVAFVPNIQLQAFQKWVDLRSNEALMAPVPGLAGTVPWMIDALAA